MSDIDLTEAVEAAARDWWKTTYPTPWETAGVFAKQDVLDEVRATLMAALPIIERQVREQVAQDLLAEEFLCGLIVTGYRKSVAEIAASIARAGA